jgi:hypothetical protein
MEASPSWGIQTFSILFYFTCTKDGEACCLGHPEKRPTDTQNRPTNTQKRPTDTQKRPTDTQKMEKPAAWGIQTFSKGII